MTPAFKVFVSSTYIDNVDRREVVRDAIERAGMKPEGMEIWSASARPALAESLGRLRECQLFVCIVAHRYGHVPESAERSITELEYDEAKRLGLPCFVFVAAKGTRVDPDEDFDPEPERWDKQKQLKAFKEKLSGPQTARPFQDDKLGVLVLQALKDHFEQQPSSGAPARGAPAPRRPPLADYRRWVREQHARLVPYFPQATERLLEEVYVELDVHEEEPTHSRKEALHSPGARTTLRGLLLSEPGQDGHAPRWVVQGEPGAGKTTLARSLAHALAVEDGPVPVFLSLARLHGATFDPLALACADALPDPDQSAQRTELEADLRERAARTDTPGLVFLLDGLDEVDPKAIDAVCARIEALAAEFPRVPLALSTRPIALERRELARRFRLARVQPLGEKQRNNLLTNLLVDPEDAAAVIAHLAERPALADLARNPLMLTLIAVVARDTILAEGSLPAHRGRLYQTAIDLLLRRGYGFEKKPVRDRVAARRFLQGMAYRLHELGGEAWTHEQLSDVVTAVGRADADLDHHLVRTWERSNDVFLEDIGLNSGVIGPHDGRKAQWRFLHRSLREFLAAEELAKLDAKVLDERIAAWKAEMERAEKARASGEPPSRPVPDPERWGEVFGLLAGIVPRPTSVLEAIRKASPELSLRALPSVEVLGLEEGLGFLLSTPGWDAATLLQCVRTWRARPEALRKVLWEHLRPELDDDELGQIGYVLERLGAPIEPKAFFAKVRPGLPHAPPIQWARIPAGSFAMGSREGQADEQPQHPVAVDEFWLARTPVTMRQFELMRGKTSKDRSPLPAVAVSWWEAWLFCKWIGARLPSEAEWEYACRAGTTTEYWSGDTEADLARVGWYSENSTDLQPVGRKPANPWGLRDMHGNVWEWCEDSWHPNYEGAPVDGRAWVDEASVDRVVRGGSFGLPAGLARSAYRTRIRPSERWHVLGFRPARSVTPD
jgi:sulfatase-modifying factor enzyme 1/uncharacterized protein DUF4062/NACHT domain-containing protein